MICSFENSKKSAIIPLNSVILKCRPVCNLSIFCKVYIKNQLCKIGCTDKNKRQGKGKTPRSLRNDWNAKNDTNDEARRERRARYGRITGHVRHDFCGTAFKGTMCTIYYFVTPEVLIFDQFLKFFLFLRITLSLSCLLTYKIL